MCQRISSPLNAATEGGKAKKKCDLPHFLLFHIDDKDFCHFPVITAQSSKLTAPFILTMTKMIKTSVRAPFGHLLCEGANTSADPFLYFELC